jgi:hypothetical protein
VLMFTIQAASAQQAEPDVFEVQLPAHVLDLPIPDSGRDLRSAIGSITAFADGEQCTEPVEIGNAEDEVILYLGLDGQPSVCSREGAIVTFKEERGFWLDAWFVLEPDTRVVLDNFAPSPPCDPGPCPTPGPSPTPGFSPTAPAVPTPAATSTQTPVRSGQTILPPDTGSAGLLP